MTVTVRGPKHVVIDLGIIVLVPDFDAEVVDASATRLLTIAGVQKKFVITSAVDRSGALVLRFRPATTSQSEGPLWKLKFATWN